MARRQVATITPAQALERLKEGNQRFLRGSSQGRSLLRRVRETSAGQSPFAVVLGCIDSRVPPELIFNCSIGDIFVLRIAGNVITEAILGSMEFACQIVGAKHILVLGHTDCGAIQGAKEGVKLGHLTGLLDQLSPAVQAAASGAGTDAIAELNVAMSINAIRQRSQILQQLEAEGQIAVSGAMYAVANGTVTFF